MSNTTVFDVGDQYDEDEEEFIATSSFVNFDNIEPVKFKDECLKKLKFENYADIYMPLNTAEVTLDADDRTLYFKYKYSLKYKIQPEYISFNTNVFDKSFFDAFVTKMDVPRDSFLINHYYDNKIMELSDTRIAFKGFMVYFNGFSAQLIYDPKMLLDKNSDLYILLGLIKTYKNPTTRKNRIFVVYQSKSGFSKKAFGVKNRDINLNINYNTDFPDVSADIIRKLNNKTKNGLVILHGEPGTGKTTYIRYLASKLERDIIFISPDMVNHITDPSFIPFLMDNSNAILIIEDAEPALQTRVGDGRSGAVSNILNMTDGLLSDCLNLSIVATFNTKTKDIDSALMRKGRLLKSYYFEKLAKEKSQNILDINKIKVKAKGPMSLAEIYFAEDDNNPQELCKSRPIGFH